MIWGGGYRRSRYPFAEDVDLGAAALEQASAVAGEGRRQEVSISYISRAARPSAMCVGNAHAAFA